MVTASAVLPMLGRPARITRSEGCRPPSFWSRPVSRVGTPETLPTLCQALSMCLIAARQHDGNGAELALDLALLGEAEQLLLGELDLLAARLRARRRRRRG